jgi:hypothetical protein
MTCTHVSQQAWNRVAVAPLFDAEPGELEGAFDHGHARADTGIQTGGTHRSDSAAGCARCVHRHLCSSSFPKLLWAISSLLLTRHASQGNFAWAWCELRCVFVAAISSVGDIRSLVGDYRFPLLLNAYSDIVTNASDSAIGCMFGLDTAIFVDRSVSRQLAGGGSFEIRRRNPARGIGVRPGLPARLPKDGVTRGTRQIILRNGSNGSCCFNHLKSLE